METIKRLKNCINWIISRHPFFANFLTKLELIADETIETGCTNGKILKFNPTWVNSLDRKQLIFFIMHEISHLFLKHHLREGDKDHQIFNQAGDYAANSFLKSYGIELLPDCLYNSDFEEMNAEKIYSIIYQDQKQNGQGNNQQNQNNQNQGQGNNQDNIKGNYGEFEQDKTETAEEIKQAEDKIDQEIIQAVQIGKLAGNENGFLKKYVKQLTKSKISWQESLLNYFDTFNRNDYSWQKPNNRYLSSGFYLPSLHNKEIDKIACYIDASGSIDLILFNKFITELKQISLNFETSIDLFLFNTTIYQSITDYQDQEILISGGGTSYVDISNKIAETSSDYSVNLIFTDGYCNDFGNNQEKVLWVVYNNLGFNPPYGETIIINNNN